MQAHQWFGNLATLADWTELWVNEGFATYFEAVLADAYQPGMGYLTNFFHDTTSVGACAAQMPGAVVQAGCTVFRRWAVLGTSSTVQSRFCSWGHHRTGRHAGHGACVGLCSLSMR